MYCGSNASLSPLIYEISIEFFGTLYRSVGYRYLACDLYRSLEQNLNVQLRPSDETLEQGRNRDNDVLSDSPFSCLLFQIGTFTKN